MNKLILLVSLFISTVSFAQTPAEKEILCILDTQTQSWNAGDIPSFMKGYWVSDSLMFIGKNGITYGYAQTLANYLKNYPSVEDMGKLNFDIKKTTLLSSEACFVIGKWHLKRGQKGDLSGHFTLLFRRLDGQWVIVADHSS
jgi:ketosteroid isomerase-like protein